MVSLKTQDSNYSLLIEFCEMIYSTQNNASSCHQKAIITNVMFLSLITVNACMATCGSLWLTLLIIDRRHSFGLQRRQEVSAEYKHPPHNLAGCLP